MVLCESFKCLLESVKDFMPPLPKAWKEKAIFLLKRNYRAVCALHQREMFGFLISPRQFVTQVQTQSQSSNQSVFCLLSSSRLLNVIVLVMYFSKVQQPCIMESRFCFGEWYCAVILLDQLRRKQVAVLLGSHSFSVFISLSGWYPLQCRPAPEIDFLWTTPWNFFCSPSKISIQYLKLKIPG